jgi:hypothetical protein
MLSRRLAIAGAIVAFVIAYASTQAYGNHYLRSIDRRESHIIELNRQANAALDRLEPKVRRLRPTNAKAGTMVASLHGTNRTLGRMERSVASLNRRIRALSRALAATQASLGGVSGSVGSTVTGIQSVNGGLGSTASAVDGISTDVGATRGALATFPGQLAATNDRLDYINRIVGRLGDAGITSNIVLTIKINGAKVGTTTIRATILPRETWKLP